MVDGGSALDGIRIIDVSTVIAGPFATQFLAEHGAEVMKIEPPAGDISRRAGKACEQDMSPIFQHINRGKHSIVLDLKQAADRARLLAMVTEVDALVCNSRPDAMRRLGLTYDDIVAVNPSIVYCSVTGYGTNGPYGGLAAYDDLIQGLSGTCDLMARGSDDRVPRYVPMALADRVVGLYAAIALLTALIQRQRTGRGCQVEIPMFESMTHFVMVEHMFQRSFDPPIGEAVSPRVAHPSRRPYRTADGYLCVLPYTDRNWRDLFAITGSPELIEDPRFADFAGRLQNPDPLNRHIATALLRETSAHWIGRLRAADIAVMPMHRVDDVLTDPHLKAVGFFQSVPMSDHRFNHMRSPVLWNSRPSSVQSAAPRLGERANPVTAVAAPNWPKFHKGADQ